MTPLDYANEIVLPAVREALEQRFDRRRAYTACILTYHLSDYLTRDHRALGERHGAAHGRVAAPSLQRLHTPLPARACLQGPLRAA